MRRYTFVGGDGSAIVVVATNAYEARKTLTYQGRPKTLRLLKSEPI